MGDTTKPTVGDLRRLVGNPDVYARQTDDGSWYPVRERLTPKVLREHREGAITVGTYIVRPPDQARTLVFDIDAEDLKERDRQVNAVTKVLAALDLEYAVEFSGKKGYHIWVVASDFMPAETLYRLGRGIREEAELPALEVFPKQTHVRDLGNLVKLPGGVHRVTNKHNDFIGPVPEANEPSRLAELAELYPEVGVRARTGERGESFPCVTIIQEGITEGGRNVHLFHLATVLRKFSISDENVEAIVRRANEKSDPPVDEEELQAILENSKWSGPMCSQIDSDKHCGESCMLARHAGLYTRSGALRWAAEGEEVVVTVLERTDEGRIVELDHPDIVQGRVVLGEAPPPKSKTGRRKKDV